MARTPKVETLLPGLYHNGARIWVRTVRAPGTQVSKPLSTGTTDVARANRIKRWLDDAQDQPKLHEWLALAVAGEVTLDRLYTHAAAGTLADLRKQLETSKAAEKDADLRPWVDEWVKTRLAESDVDETTRGNYERQVRFFIPSETPLPKSKFTEDYVEARLAELKGARHDRNAKASSGTRRRYLVALQQFVRYARRKVPLDFNPLENAEEADWWPKNGSARSTHWEHDRVLKVLSHMAGDEREAMALIFGSGIELGALLDLKGAHIGKTLDDGRGTIVAPGSKNEFREDRTIFVDAWAWKIFEPRTRLLMPKASVFNYNVANGGKELRDAFYAAQVAAGLIERPATNPKTRKLLWGRVKPHTIHDARHSYAVNRSLGLDGEEPQDASFIANQLGHADETMVLRVYKKANVKERLRLIQQQQAKKAAKAAGGK